MAKGLQSPPWTSCTTTTTTFITIILALVASLTLCSGVRQGCHLHPQEKLVSCRGVTSDILREFLMHVNTTTTAPTAATTTTTTTPTTTTTTSTDKKNNDAQPPPLDTTTTTTSTTTIITIITTTSPPSPDNTSDVNATTTTQQHINNTTTATTTTVTTTEGESGDDNIKNANTKPDRYDTSGVTELSCVGCRLPHLAPSLLATPVTLERLSVVDSGVEAVIPGALTSHAPTLVHLDLSYNLLRVLPKDVVSLMRLQVLDLRHNKILEVAEGTVLTHLHGLRHLYLDHNQLGQTLTSSRGQRSHLSVFDLWASNVTAALSRLSHLGLSHNGIKDVPDGAFSNLSSLLLLDLSDNLLPSLRPSALPPSVLELDLTGNPWNCTCDATWILERHARLPPTPSFLLSSTPPLSSTSLLSPSPAATAGTILSPTCSSPLHLHRRQLDSLTVSEVCPLEEDAAGDEVVYVGDDVEGTLKEAFRTLRLLNATSLTTHALLVSWRVDALFYALSAPPREPLSWAVTVREVRQGPREAHVTHLSLERYRREQPHWAPGDSLFAEVLEDLRPATGYVVCLTVEQRRRLYTRPSHCLHGTTLTSPPPRPTPPITPADVPLTATTPEALQSYSTRDYVIRTEGFTAWAAESRSATLSWNVTMMLLKGGSVENLLLRPLGWRVTFRHFKSEEEEEEEEVVLVSRGGEPLQNFTNHYSIEGLQPDTRYVFCLHTLTEEEVQESLTEDGAVEMPRSASPPLPAGVLSWETHSHSQPTAARGRSVVDSRGGAGRQQLETLDDTLAPSPPPRHPLSAAGPTVKPPESSMPPPDPREDSLFNALAAGSGHAFVHNTPPQPSSTSASSNIPPPPSLPTLPANRPPRPPRPESGGGFVYTSTGLRIPLPSGSSGPFSVPPPIPISRPSTRRDLPPEPPSRSPSRQRYIYEFDETSVSPPPTLPPPPPPSSKRQIYTYATRRRREVAGRRPPRGEAAPLCRQVMTPVELDVVLPAAIAGTVSCAATVVVVLVVCCCCWPRRCCRRKGAWRARSTTDSRKVSTISAPTPVTVFSAHSSGATAAAAGRGDGDATASRREDPGDLGIAGRTVSAAPSSVYLTPLHAPDGRDPHSQNPDPKAAYLSLMQSRLLQRHKDLPEFHPGYDIPPMASTKSLVGYDYPHPIPVNLIGSGGGGTQKPAAASPPLLPSPSSSDSNYNVSVGNSPEPTRSPAEVNLNIPCQQPKSSALTKRVHIPPGPADKSDYNYINPKETPATTAARTYLKHPPSRTRNHRFGQPQPGAAEHSGPLSRSTPDLVTATTDAAEAVAAAAPTNLPLRKDPFPTTPSTDPTSLPPAASGEDLTGYANFPAPQKDSETSRRQEPPLCSGSSDVKERETYHTWGGHRARPRPSVGDVVLTGGTLIEVPEGYVQPQAPKPTPYIRLLVRGQDGPKDSSLGTPTPPPAHTEALGGAPRPSHGSSVTHLLASGADHNTLVISTAPAS